VNTASALGSANGIVDVPAGPAITTPNVPRLIVSPLVVRAGPPGVSVVAPITRLVGVAVRVCEPSVKTASDVGSAGSAEMAEKLRVDVPEGPATTRPCEPRLSVLPAVVRAGPPGVRVVAPTTRPVGAAVRV